MTLSEKIENDPAIMDTISRIEQIFYENKKHNPFSFPWTNTEKLYSRSIYLTQSVVIDSPFTFFIGINFRNKDKLVFKLKPLFTKLANQISNISGVNFYLNQKTIGNQIVIGISN